MAPAGDAGAPFRLVARADLDVLVGGFQPRGERAPGRAPRHPVTATALLFDPGGETLHVACAGAEVCVAHCRIAQGTTPSGDVRARFVVDDVTPSPRPPAPPSEAAPPRPESPPPRGQVVDRTIRELCAIPSRRCVAARADAGVEVHYYDDRCSSVSRAASRARVFVIPGTAGAAAIASDRAYGNASASRVAVASPGGRKRVVVYDVPPFPRLSRASATDGSRSPKRASSRVVFDVAADIALGLAHPARAMAWLGATLVIGTPRGAVAVRVADGSAKPVAGARKRTEFSRRDENETPRDGRSRRARSRASSRAALAALAPRRPSPDGASYDTMFGSSARRQKDGARPREADPPAAPALAVASDGGDGGDVSLVSRAPDGTLMRVWLKGGDTRGDAQMFCDDGDEHDDDAMVYDDDDDDDGHVDASVTDSKVLARVPAALDLGDARLARSEPADVTCAHPFAVAAPRGGGGGASAVDLTGLAPGDTHALTLGMSGDGAREDAGRANARLLIAGAPGGAALGRGDDGNDENEGASFSFSFSCPASASALLAARGGVLELHRARSTRERVVALAVAGRLEEAVALADARGGDVPSGATPSGATPSGATPSSSAFAVATRAECGFLAAARLDFALAASLWRSAGEAVSLSELLPYFPRQGGSKTAFRGGVEASAVGAGAENDAKRFVSRLGAREIVAARWRPGAPLLADLETVVAAHESRPTPREVERLCRGAKKRFVALFAARPARDGDPRKRRLDTLTLRLWAETGDAANLERALRGEETAETTANGGGSGRDVDVSVLGPALTASGRHFARAVAHWRLEGNDDAAFDTYAALAKGALVEAPVEASPPLPKGPENENGGDEGPQGHQGSAAAPSRAARRAARLAARLLRERCREDLRGGARPDDEAAARWTRRHIGWILREAPEEGVAALATPRVARAIDFQFVAEACVSANATRATRARVLLDRVRPFAPDRANGDAHTAAAVALWEAAEEETLRAETGASTDAADRKSWFDAARFLAFLRQEPRRVDARAALAALDPNAVTSSSVRGALALGLVTGVRVAPPAIPKALARHAAALAELRAAAGDHVAAYRLLAEVAGDAAAADAHVARFGDDARRARDRVLELANRPPRGEDPKPRFSLRGKF